jgi:serine/threonine protein kinase
MSNGAKARSDPLIGQEIQGRYRVIRELGRGGMGKVYLAEQLSIGRRVALKVLHEMYTQNPEVLTRFRREAQLAASLDNHLRVVTIYDCGEMEDGSVFIVMEYVQGRTLREVIGGPLPIRQAVSLAIQIAEGLHVVHRAGILHRDVKPQNIMVRQTEEEEAVKLMDFGIARPLDSHTQLTHVGFAVGTAGYMAPEITQHGQYSQQSDLYAWGIVLYEMLTGKVPFTAPTPEALALKHWHESPVPLRQVRPEVPAAIEQLVVHTLEKKPEDRPKNMREVITRLRTVEGDIREEVTGPTVIATPLGREEKKEEHSRQKAGKKIEIETETEKKAEKKRGSEKAGQRRWRTWLGGGLSVALAGALAVWVVMSGTVSPPVPEDLSRKPIPPQETPVEIATPSPAADNQAITDHLHVGQFYLDRGEYPEAIAEFEAAKALASGHQEIQDLLDRAQQAKQAEEELLLAR